MNHLIQIVHSIMYIQGQAERMRLNSVFLQRLQIVWDISNLYSFFCVHELFTIVNSLRTGNQIQDVPKLFKSRLQMAVLFCMPVTSKSIKHVGKSPNLPQKYKYHGLLEICTLGPSQPSTGSDTLHYRFRHCRVIHYFYKPYYKITQQLQYRTKSAAELSSIYSLIERKKDIIYIKELKNLKNSLTLTEVD